MITRRHTEAYLDKGREPARATVRKDSAGKTARCAELLKLAERIA